MITPQRDGKGNWYAQCLPCEWRSATHGGLLAVIYAFDEADLHDHENHYYIPDQHLNPDCMAGKHSACNRDAWCSLNDLPINCCCPCHRNRFIN